MRASYRKCCVVLLGRAVGRSNSRGESVLWYFGFLARVRPRPLPRTVATFKNITSVRPPRVRNFEPTAPSLVTPHDEGRAALYPSNLIGKVHEKRGPTITAQFARQSGS
jgi:hypothetical protein